MLIQKTIDEVEYPINGHFRVNGYLKEKQERQIGILNDSTSKTLSYLTIIENISLASLMLVMFFQDDRVFVLYCIYLILTFLTSVICGWTIIQSTNQLKSLSSQTVLSELLFAITKATTVQLPRLVLQNARLLQESCKSRTSQTVALEHRSVLIGYHKKYLISIQLIVIAKVYSFLIYNFFKNSEPSNATQAAQWMYFSLLVIINLVIIQQILKLQRLIPFGNTGMEKSEQNKNMPEMNRNTRSQSCEMAPQQKNILFQLQSVSIRKADNSVGNQAASQNDQIPYSFRNNQEKDKSKSVCLNPDNIICISNEIMNKNTNEEPPLQSPQNQQQLQQQNQIMGGIDEQRVDQINLPQNKNIVTQPKSPQSLPADTQNNLNQDNQHPLQTEYLSNLKDIKEFINNSDQNQNYQDTPRSTQSNNHQPHDNQEQQEQDRKEQINKNSQSPCIIRNISCRYVVPLICESEGLNNKKNDTTIQNSNIICCTSPGKKLICLQSQRELKSAAAAVLAQQDNNKESSRGRSSTLPSRLLNIPQKHNSSLPSISQNPVKYQILENRLFWQAVTYLESFFQLAQTLIFVLLCIENTILATVAIAVWSVYSLVYCYQNIYELFTAKSGEINTAHSLFFGYRIDYLCALYYKQFHQLKIYAKGPKLAFICIYKTAVIAVSLFYFQKNRSVLNYANLATIFFDMLIFWLKAPAYYRVFIKSQNFSFDIQLRPASLSCQDIENVNCFNKYLNIIVYNPKKDFFLQDTSQIDQILSSSDKMIYFEVYNIARIYNKFGHCEVQIIRFNQALYSWIQENLTRISKSIRVFIFTVYNDKNTLMYITKDQLLSLSFHPALKHDLTSDEIINALPNSYFPRKELTFVACYYSKIKIFSQVLAYHRNIAPLLFNNPVQVLYDLIEQ